MAFGVENISENPAPGADKIYQLPARTESISDVVPAAERRDWSAAIDLVNEASNAVRWAEERAQSAEDHSKQLATIHKDQLRAAEQRVMNAEKRAEAATLRANEAEAWLARFHDAIVEGFGPNLKSLVAAAPR